MINKHKRIQTTAGVVNNGGNKVWPSQQADDLYVQMPRMRRRKVFAEPGQKHSRWREERIPRPPKQGKKIKEAKVSRRQGGRPEGLRGRGTGQPLVGWQGFKAKSGVT